MIRDAVILAAGMGTRLAESQENPSAFSKPLLEVGGRTLIGHVIDACVSVGVRRVIVVTGYHAELVEMESRRSSCADVVPVYNDRWREPNGVSVLAAEPHVDAEFLLMMADHLFDPGILTSLAEHVGRPGVTLAVDPRLDEIVDLDDATKVRREGDRIVAIGKRLSDYDAADCGLFRCTSSLFPALHKAAEEGPPSLSSGLAVLLRQKTFEAMEIGDRWWQDVDTPEMAEAAERMLDRIGKGHG